MSDYLSEELIVEIFSRLPTKSLLRFRSVSKSLCCIISSRAFIRMHTCRSRKKVVLLRHVCRLEHFHTLHPEDQLPFRGYIGMTPVEFPFHTKLLNIVGSCNGILCVVEYGCFNLWNPSIRRKLTLPGPPKRCPLKTCDPAIGIGFGFDPINDDYKIVTIRCAGTELNEQTAFVYAVKTGVWSEIANMVTPHGCFANGALHWVVQRHSTNPWDDADLRDILTFDLSTHVFGMIALPKPNCITIQLANIKGSLAVASTDDDCALWLWVRRDASWSVVFKWEENVFRGEPLKILATSNCELLLLTPIVDVYTPETRYNLSLPNFSPGGSGSLIFDFEMFTECLELLHTGTACEVKQLSSSLFRKRKRSIK